MKDKNRELAADILSALYAKEKLDEIVELVKRSGDAIKKADILKILESGEDII